MMDLGLPYSGQLSSISGGILTETLDKGLEGEWILEKKNGQYLCPCGGKFAVNNMESFTRHTTTTDKHKKWRVDVGNGDGENLRPSRCLTKGQLIRLMESGESQIPLPSPCGVSNQRKLIIEWDTLSDKYGREIAKKLMISEWNARGWDIEGKVKEPDAVSGAVANCEAHLALMSGINNLAIAEPIAEPIAGVGDDE